MIYFIRNNKWDLMEFIWSGIKTPHEIIDLPPLLNTQLSKFLCKIAHLFWHIGIFLRWRYFEPTVYSKLKTLKPGDHVIFVGYFARAVLNLTPYIPKGVSIHLSFWDKIQNLQDFNTLMPVIKKLNIDIVSYDKEDAQKYGLRWIPQYYNFSSFPHFEQKNNNEYYYMGSFVEEYRKDILNQIKEALTKFGLKEKILLVDNNKTKWISYRENLQHVADCAILIELNKPGQFGLTMRTMEALALKKKLITNNPDIKSYSFYNRNNIFIFGENHFEELPLFLSKEYLDIPKDIVEENDVNTWLTRVISNENN